jgi:hypothetical protein
VRDPEARCETSSPYLYGRHHFESFPSPATRAAISSWACAATHSGVKHSINVYRQAWQDAGHPGQGDVTLRMPVYVGQTHAQAIADPQASTLGTTVACLTA